MLRAKILRVDRSMLVDDVDIEGRNGRRGTHDGHVWRGIFRMPAMQLRPTLGEDLILVLGDNSHIQVVVIAVEGSQIHFRAAGRVPKVEAEVQAG